MRIEHDPDRGCFGCPLYSDEMGDDGVFHYTCSAATDGHDLDREVTPTPAPAWCPLRSDVVTVTAPLSEADLEAMERIDNAERGPDHG